MLTDWLLILRLARELDERLAGARVRDAGLLADGRIALVLNSRGSDRVVAIDAFASPPLVTLEDGELAIGVEPGFVRALATSLRAMLLLSVRARRGDRLLRFTFGSRSRFGVADRLELYVELVPRFGNLVLVKGERIVAAAKEFSMAQNPARPIQRGLAYVPPPLPAAGVLVPKLVAETADPAAALAAAESNEALQSPLYVYRRNGVLEQAHLVPLPRFAGIEAAREPSLLDVFSELRAESAGRGAAERSERRRRAIVKRLDERERKLREELASLERKRRRAEERDALRSEGERIYATLHELHESEREAAKERANELFDDYKRIASALPHIAARETRIAALLEAIETLRWEAERAGEREIDDVERAVAGLEPHRRPNAAAPAVRARKRPPLEFRTPSGSRITVGRSPAENADLTFRQARPHDLWFHARGIPGAHVVLARDDRSDPPDDDLRAAASLAAFYSKGAASGTVTVDYTLRKHVRKQRDAPPGLVWYTHAKSVAAAPRKEL